MAKAYDLLNKVFNRLTVIEKTNERKNGSIVWKCQCNCSDKTICYMSANDLVTGRIKSCGCLRRENCSNKSVSLLGQTFGRLTVVEKTNKRQFGNVIWRCECSCKNSVVIEVAARHLRSGSVQSCGCLQSKGESIINSLLQENGLCCVKNYSFSDLISNKKRRLYFDFAVLDENKQLLYLIEFDGEQHFYYSKGRFGGQTYEEFLENIKRDEIKNKYCIDNNILLIRIPFWKEKEIVVDMLKPKTICPSLVVKDVEHNKMLYEQYLSTNK